MTQYNRTSFLSLTLVGLLAVGIIGCDKSAEATNSSTATQHADVTDLDVATNVKSALLKDDAVGIFDITVIVSNGDVRLSGFVDNAAQLEQALNLARSVQGVRTVYNELKIRETEN